MNKLQRYYRVTLRSAAAVSMLLIAFAVSAAARDTDAAAVASSGRVALTGHVLPALASATVDSSKAKAITDDEPLTLTVVLNRSDPDGFAAYLADVYDPASTTFRQFLTPTQVSDRFGPSPTAYDSVLRYLADANLQLVEASANRMTLSVRGTRTDVERCRPRRSIAEMIVVPSMGGHGVPTVRGLPNAPSVTDKPSRGTCDHFRRFHHE